MKQQDIVYGQFYRTADRNIVQVLTSKGSILDGPFIGVTQFGERMFKMNGGGNFTAKDLTPATSNDIKWLRECTRMGEFVPENLVNNNLKEY